MYKNYYQILGISENDDAEHIKAAYHRMARKWHPDIASNKDEAIKKFKEINEAYQVLSDKFKKTEYDKAKSFYDYAQKNKNEDDFQSDNIKESNCNKKTKKKTNSFDWKKIFINNKNNENDPIKGEDIYTEIEISYTDALYGTKKIINILQTLNCPYCNGKKFINGGFCKHCGGSGNITSYKKFTVKIPAGIKNHSKLRLAKEGEKGIRGGENGDLYINILIKENDEYKLDGLDIHKKIKIEPYLAILGGNVELNIFPEKYSIKIAPGTQNGQKIRLSKCGIVQNNKIGDMIITVEIKIPKKLSTEELKLYRDLEALAIRRNKNNYE